MWGGNKKRIDIYNQEKIAITIPKKIKRNLKFSVKFFTPFLAPIKKDQVIAEFIIKKQNNEVLKKFDLYSRDSVDKMSFFSKIIQNFKYLLLGDSIFIEQ